MHQKGLLVEALVAYGEALRFCPNYLQALTDLASIYILFDRPQAALAYLRRAQEIDGSNKTSSAEYGNRAYGRRRIR